MRQWLAASREELTGFMRDAGQPAFRAKQVWEWLHTRRVDDVAAMANVPKAVRALLSDAGAVRTLEARERREADDGLTAKWLFAAPGDDGEARVESVLIIEKHLSRRTVCVSCMAGCPLGCAFCATGRLGFDRNLSAAEIIEQVYRIDAHSRSLGDGMGVSHVVFMGMGEPLLTLDPVLAAAGAFADPAGMGLSGRHITISTAGVPDGIRRLAAAGTNYRLAVSLHAPNQAVRERIMPAAARWPLDDLFSALTEFAKTSSRDITFEYCLLRGVNAAESDADELARLLAGLRCKVNLIPYNPTPGAPFSPPSPGAVRRFQARLEAHNVPATVRMEKGQDIGAACGQLRAENRE